MSASEGPTRHSDLDFYSIKRNLKALSKIKRNTIPYTNTKTNLIEAHKGFVYSKKKENFHPCVIERTFSAAFDFIQEATRVRSPRSSDMALNVQAKEIKGMLRSAIKGVERIVFIIKIQHRQAGLDVERVHKELKSRYSALTNVTAPKGTQDSRKVKTISDVIASSFKPDDSEIPLSELRSLSSRVEDLRYRSKKPKVARDKKKMFGELQLQLSAIREKGMVDAEDFREWEERMGEERRKKSQSSTKFAFLNSPLFKKLGGMVSDAGKSKMIPKWSFKRTREVSPYIYEEQPQLQRSTSFVHFTAPEATRQNPQLHRACSELFDQDFINFLKKRRDVVGLFDD